MTMFSMCNATRFRKINDLKSAFIEFTIIGKQSTDDESKPLGFLTGGGGVPSIPGLSLVKDNFDRFPEGNLSSSEEMYTNMYDEKTLSTDVVNMSLTSSAADIVMNDSEDVSSLFEDTLVASSSAETTAGFYTFADKFPNFSGTMEYTDLVSDITQATFPPTENDLLNITDMKDHLTSGLDFINSTESITTDSSFNISDSYDVISTNFTSTLLDYTTSLFTYESFEGNESSLTGNETTYFGGNVTFSTHRQPSNFSLRTTLQPVAVVDDEYFYDDEQNITAFISQFYDKYEFISEGYIMTLSAALGIILNTLAIVALSRDRRLRPMSRVMHNIFFTSEQIFLGLAIAYLLFRTHFLPASWSLDPLEGLDVENYVTSFFGLAQTLSTWLLYVTATDAYHSVRLLVDPTKGSMHLIRGGILNMLLVILIALAFYSAYLPPVRVAIYNLIEENWSEEEYHDLCNVPLKNHWDFTLREVKKTDLFYILYYSLGYILFLYVLPFILICCRNKDIIDILHRAQKHPSLISEASNILCPALAVSVMCNVYLVCMALKMVILTFKIFEFANAFAEGAKVFFKYLNVYSNFLQILKSSLHVGVIMMYNERLRLIILRAWGLENFGWRKKKKRHGDVARACTAIALSTTTEWKGVIKKSQTTTTEV